MLEPQRSLSCRVKKNQQSSFAGNSNQSLVIPAGDAYFRVGLQTALLRSSAPIWPSQRCPH